MRDLVARHHPLGRDRLRNAASANQDPAPEGNPPIVSPNAITGEFLPTIPTSSRQCVFVSEFFD